MASGRSGVVSSFTVIKGSLVGETYSAFQHWDLSASKEENLSRLKATNPIGATSANWLRDVAFVLNRRFDPDGRDRPLVELAQVGCRREIWNPILLWHMTRDEFLVRDFLSGWLYEQYAAGAWRLRADDVQPYLASLHGRGVDMKDSWSPATTKRVASGLLKIAVDFGLMTGTIAREFVSYHLPDEAFLYILHAMAETEHNARRVVESPDWRMFMMAPEDVERELFRLHQFRRVHYEVAGTIAQLDLPHRTAAEYARELAA